MVKKIQPRTALHHGRSEPQEHHVKIGLILECAKDGPDQQVCEYLVKQLQPNTEVESRTLTNKKELISQCGETAAILLNQGCERVVIVWDLYPPWRRRENPCRLEDREAIFRSLNEAGVSSPNVYLVCIREELEAWLLADKRAIAAAIHRLTGHVPRITDVKHPESIRNPKVKLDNIFRQHTHRPYQGHNHALKIIKELPDFNKIRRCDSFTRFVLKATDTQL